eukprot:gene24990-31392_t
MPTDSMRPGTPPWVLHQSALAEIDRREAYEIKLVTALRACIAPLDATQGHRYRWRGRDVLALQSGTKRVRVAPIVGGEGYPLGQPQTAPVRALRALPMAYFHGQVPA